MGQRLSGAKIDGGTNVPPLKIRGRRTHFQWNDSPCTFCNCLYMYIKQADKVVMGQWRRLLVFLIITVERFLRSY